MGKLTEKQLILAMSGAFALVIAGIGYMTYSDMQRISSAEITPENPDAAAVSDPNEWGEKRKIQELQIKIDAAQAEADLIPKREQDVIVYREIVERDADILPDASDVNVLATTIGDFERISGVALSRVLELNTNHGGQAIASIPIKLAATGSFDEILKFINLFENYDRLVNTRAFNITAGPVMGTGRDQKALHKVSFDFETYMYTASAGLQSSVKIDDYERRVETPVIQKLIRQQKSAKVEGYQLKPRINRRDPLVDPRRVPDEGTETDDGEDFGDQKRMVNQLRLEVELLKDDVRQEAQYLEEKRYVAYTQIRRMIDEKVVEMTDAVAATEPRITIPELRAILQDDVIEPFLAMKEARVADEGTATVRVMTRKEVEEFRDRMRAALEERDYEQVLQIMHNFEALANSIEVAENAAGVVEEMGELVNQAQVMLDFEALGLAYSGVIYRESGSRVIVNGRTRKEGDYVDDGNRCRIAEIKKDGVVYEFDGFEIEDPLKSR